jgi:hypothetical protein
MQFVTKYLLSDLLINRIYGIWGPTSLAELSVLGTYDLMCFFVVTSYNFEVAFLLVVVLDIGVLLLTLTH